MLAKFLSRRALPPPPVPCIPPGRRVYAIGDIHGRLDCLDALFEGIADDQDGRPPCPTSFIFLGDLIDRGPDSAGVIDRLIAFAGSGTDARFLLGNHEEVMLAAIGGDLASAKLFHRIGGDATLLSYGIDPVTLRDAEFDDLPGLIAALVPPRHITFLQGFEDVIELGDYAFVHAGIRPGVPLAEQNPEDLRWIRALFLRHPGPHPKVIVHGHSITDTVEEQPWRIGLDTGAYASGRLTAMGFEGDRRWTVQTGPSVADRDRTVTQS